MFENRFTQTTKAFTLTELLVSMILTGMLTGFAYWSYLALQGYYYRITAQQDLGLHRKEILFQLGEDVRTAEWVLSEARGVVCIRGLRRVQYSENQGITRRNQAAKTDTLFSNSELVSKSIGNDSTLGSLVSMVIIRFNSGQDSLVVFKEYAPGDFAAFANLKIQPK